jgi:DNA-binding MarR family transcriptional regulator
VAVDPAELFSELIRFETELWNAVEARLRQAHALDLSWFEPMQVIERTPACRVHDIAAALSITVGGTSKLVDRIEAAGWCQRRSNPDDSRSSLIELTPAGRRLLAAASRTFAKEVDVHFGSALTPRALQQFSTSVRQLRVALRSRSAPAG